MSYEIELFAKYIAIEDGELGTPTSPTAIANFEKKYKVQLPKDVKDYFYSINGTYEGHGFITIRPLEAWCLFLEDEFAPKPYIKKVIDTPEKYFLFGSYDISVWYWLIELKNDPHVDTPIFVFHTSLIKIANNFTEFLNIYREKGAESLLS